MDCALFADLDIASSLRKESEVGVPVAALPESLDVRSRCAPNLSEFTESQSTGFSSTVNNTSESPRRTRIATLPVAWYSFARI